MILRKADSVAGRKKNGAGRKMSLDVSAAGGGQIRQAVVVLAMHRSGSSAITRVLNLVGCDLPRTLMGGNASNELGHWESTVVRKLNDDVLASGGSAWQDSDAFNPNWYRSARLAEFLPRAQQVLEDEYGKSAFIVIKDPRICQIVPFWREVLAKAGISPHVVLCLRHPVEVAESLVQRNAIPEVQGLLLWLRYVLEAESASRGLPRAVVSYDRLMAAPSETVAAIQEPLGVVWPRVSSKVTLEINEFISPQLRHHKVDLAAGFSADQPFRDWLITVYDLLLRWSQTGEKVDDWPVLDQVRVAMDNLTSPIREVVAVLSRNSADLVTLNEEVRNLRGEGERRGDAVQALTAERTALKEAIDAKQVAVTEAADRARLAIEEAANEKARAEGLVVKLTEMTAAQNAAEIARQEEAARLAGKMAELAAQNTAQVAALEADLAARDEALAEGDTARQTLQNTLIEIQSALRQRQHEAEETADALAATRQELEAAQIARQEEAARLAGEMAELTAQNTERVASLEADLAARDEALAEGDTDRQTLQNTLIEIQTALRQRQHEAKEIAAALAATRQELEAAQIARQEEAARLSGEMAELTAQNTERVASLEADLAARDEALAKGDTAQQILQNSLMEIQSALRQRQQEAEETAAALAATRPPRAWIDHAIDVVLEQAERPWLLGNRRLARKASVLRTSGLFDAEWYGRVNSDVTEAGLDPATHFILYGRSEGRAPLPEFAEPWTGLRSEPI